MVLSMTSTVPDLDGTTCHLSKAAGARTTRTHTSANAEIDCALSYPDVHCWKKDTITTTGALYALLGCLRHFTLV